jgi:transcription elongation GreA/GreB family factor
MAATETRIAELEGLLASVTVVEAPADLNSIAFGAKSPCVMLPDESEPTASWALMRSDSIRMESVGFSTIGKALFAAEVGDRITLEKDGEVEVVNVEDPTDEPLPAESHPG